jgi:plasmid maintenance system antidote protein VapI
MYVDRPLVENTTITDLYFNFLHPLNISLDAFTRHIGISIREFINKGKIDFEMATRMGEALSMDPKFWIWAQLESDLSELYVDDEL